MGEGQHAEAVGILARNVLFSSLSFSLTFHFNNGITTTARYPFREETFKVLKHRLERKPTDILG
jgi:hypothetical protein